MGWRVFRQFFYFRLNRCVEALAFWDDVLSCDIAVRSRAMAYQNRAVAQASIHLYQGALSSTVEALRLAREAGDDTLAARLVENRSVFEELVRENPSKIMFGSIAHKADLDEHK